MDYGWRYKRYLPLGCKILLRNVLTIMPSSSNEQEKVQFDSDVGLKLDGDEAYRLINEDRKKRSTHFPLSMH